MPLDLLTNQFLPDFSALRTFLAKSGNDKTRRLFSIPFTRNVHRAQLILDNPTPPANLAH
jgi:hypothetical protein